MEYQETDRNRSAAGPFRVRAIYLDLRSVYGRTKRWGRKDDAKDGEIIICWEGKVTPRISSSMAIPPRTCSRWTRGRGNLGRLR